MVTSSHEAAFAELLAAALLALAAKLAFAFAFAAAFNFAFSPDLRPFAAACVHQNVLYPHVRCSYIHMQCT